MKKQADKALKGAVASALKAVFLIVQPVSWRTGYLVLISSNFVRIEISSVSSEK